MASGIRVGGAITRTCAPRVERQMMLERATRLCSTSPHIDYQSLDMTLAPSAGEPVEQCLCRMFVSSIAGIQHRAIDLVSNQLHGALTLVPDHDHVTSERENDR